MSGLGATGDSIMASTVNSEGMHDQLYNLQMLDAAYHKLPQPKDSERARNYTPVKLHSFAALFFHTFMLCLPVYDLDTDRRFAFP